MKQLWRNIAVCILSVFFWTAAYCQSFPSKPVKIIVPLGAGGAADVITRQLAQILSERNGQPFTVENRPGANTIIGTDACAKAQADGSTLCVVTASSVSINPFLYRRLSYEPSRDLLGVAPLVMPDMAILISPTVPVQTMSQLIAYARTNPGKLAYGSFGNGSDTHLVMEWFKLQTQTDLLHVPFNGFGPMLQAFNTGDIQMMYLSVGNPGIVAQVKSGKMRALAVLAPERSAMLPEVPTLTEAGVAQPKSYTWFGIMAPSGTPTNVVRKLNEQINTAMQSAAMREQLNTMAMRTRAMSVSEFSAFLQQDRDIWRQMVKESQVSMD